MLLNVQVSLAQVALVVLEQPEVGTDDVSAGRELDVFAVIRITTAVGQFLAHIAHVTDDHRAPRPQALLADVCLALVQTTFDVIFEKVGGVLSLIAESKLQKVRESGQIEGN